MRHFTASTAIRQDGPFALSTLTGVVSIFCCYSCFRTVENLQIGLNCATCTTHKTSLCQSRNVYSEKPVRTLFGLFV